MPTGMGFRIDPLASKYLLCFDVFSMFWGGPTLSWLDDFVQTIRWWKVRCFIAFQSWHKNANSKFGRFCHHFAISMNMSFVGLVSNFLAIKSIHLGFTKNNSGNCSDLKPSCEATKNLKRWLEALIIYVWFLLRTRKLSGNLDDADIGLTLVYNGLMVHMFLHDWHVDLRTLNSIMIGTGNKHFLHLNGNLTRQVRTDMPCFLLLLLPCPFSSTLCDMSLRPMANASFWWISLEFTIKHHPFLQDEFALKNCCFLNISLLPAPYKGCQLDPGGLWIDAL